MHKKIEEMAAGICSYDNSVLQISPEALIFEVAEGQDYKGEFFI